MTDMAKHALAKVRDQWKAAGRGPTAVVVILVVLIAAGLAVYAAAASYDTVSGLAAKNGVALPRLNPVGIDGGLAGIIILDIALTWLAEPIWWLRLAVRVFAAGMIGANAAAGWPHPVGIGLRVAAPALFVTITEAGRTLLLRRRHAAERAAKAATRAARRTSRERRRKDRIPFTRWVLDPKGTFALWKRMRLWRESSYRAAVNMELERLAAIEKLAMTYAVWQREAPADLVWMLTSGVRMAEALARVAGLVTTKDELAEMRAQLDASDAAHETALRAAQAELETAQEARAEADRARAQAEERAAQLARRNARTATASRRATGARRTRASASPDEGELDARSKALRVLSEEPDISGRKLGLRVGMSARWGVDHRDELAGMAAELGGDSGSGEELS